MEEGCSRDFLHQRDREGRSRSLSHQHNGEGCSRDLASQHWYWGDSSKDLIASAMSDAVRNRCLLDAAYFRFLIGITTGRVHAVAAAVVVWFKVLGEPIVLWFGLCTGP
ncbi:hypothetical protein Tcan_17349 [Toxocara canis]|uniref:Uncharacterized protein n=1 Tax=Toxocara canis TaxID=6265 RepID=A0A0B2UNL8_TOXCA|nr:hypothetical protein Tcan_17349 [Toxocara canis]